MKTIKNSKFNISMDKDKRAYNGVVFDSQMEMKYYRDVLCPMMESGEVIRCELQPKYELQPKFTHDNKTVLPIIYIADFYVEFADGRSMVVDVKGMPSAVANLKRKMFWYCYPDTDYRWLTYVKKYGGWVSYDEAKRLRRANKHSNIQKEEN